MPRIVNIALELGPLIQKVEVVALELSLRRTDPACAGNGKAGSESFAINHALDKFPATRL